MTENKSRKANSGVLISASELAELARVVDVAKQQSSAAVESFTIKSLETNQACIESGRGEVMSSNGAVSVVFWADFVKKAIAGDGEKLLPYQQRVIDEKNDLDERVMKLIEFISLHSFELLDPVEQALLRKQCEAMRDLSSILGARIARFSVASHEWPCRPKDAGEYWDGEKWCPIGMAYANNPGKADLLLSWNYRRKIVPPTESKTE